MASSSRMLAVAVLAALFAGAMCAPTKVKFTVQKGSDAKKLVLKIDYTRAGDTLSEMELRQHGSEEWEPFTKKGDVWELSSSKPLVGPFNFRFLSKGGMKNVFDEVFSTDFKIGKTYEPVYDA
uniref:Predicted protein n=1 Tax=Hordeum vulgare subsp. vulgare TaxID=112509 RepID=F2EBI4_HORVV|nr:predicted protein [Hordeum vulgare subsp. vulgare]